MKYKINGFTIVELLAVLIILGILALIAVPVILNLVRDARNNANIKSIDNLIRASKYYYSQRMIDDEILDNINNLNDVYDVINVNGNKPEKGSLYINKTGDIALYVDFGDSYYLKKFDGEGKMYNEKSKGDVDLLQIVPSGILLDVARKYYTVDQIKDFIDILSYQKNSFLQLHFSDDPNVGIESVYLDQTKDAAIVSNGIYTNPKTGKSFLTFEQVKEIMDYCKEKNVEFIPEIDVPAHMTGFFNLARIKFGDEYVNKFAKGTGSESGNIDIVVEEAQEFIYSIYDEYTEFFKDCDIFHMGFDEYTYRIDEKLDFINDLSSYLINKGFTVRMWNDSITKDNINQINKKIQIAYWNYFGTKYATVPDLQEAGFKVILTNAYYLFFVPSTANTNEHDLNYTVNDIVNNWSLEKWDNAQNTSLNNYNNLIGSFICVWNEFSEEVEYDIIFNQTSRMYNAMVNKIKYKN